MKSNTAPAHGPAGADATSAEVLAAFERARTAGQPAVDCYRAGVEVWRNRHPEQAPEYAAKRAVALILSHYVPLKGKG